MCGRISEQILSHCSTFTGKPLRTSTHTHTHKNQVLSVVAVCFYWENENKHKRKWRITREKERQKIKFFLGNKWRSLKTIYPFIFLPTWETLDAVNSRSPNGLSTYIHFISPRKKNVINQSERNDFFFALDSRSYRGGERERVDC